MIRTLSGIPCQKDASVKKRTAMLNLRVNVPSSVDRMRFGNPNKGSVYA